MKIVQSIGVDDKSLPTLISPTHLAELYASGITDETIRNAFIHTETDPGKIAALLHWKYAAKLGKCLVFPFFDALGNRDTYAMLKPSVPRMDSKKGKPRKYELPKGQPNRAYIPSATRTALAEVNNPVLLTEGCKKTLAAIQHGYACIGLSGVWNWCKKRVKDAKGRARGEFQLIEDLAAIPWNGRIVYVVFDSDAIVNPNVRNAERQLAKVLENLRAVVKIVQLPAEPDGAKNGLDDYLVRYGKDAFADLLSVAQSPTEDEPKKKRPSAGDILVDIGLSFDLWHDATGIAYASRGRDTRAVRSKGFKHLLVGEYFGQVGDSPKTEAISNALTTIEAYANHKGGEQVAHTRIAEHGGRVYLHLADVENTVIEIDTKGWRECAKPPVYFRRSAGMLPLPKPQPGGTLDDLRHFVNCPDESAFALLKAWLSGCFRPNGPFPLIVMTGEQGSAKSTTGRVLKRLLDPSSAPLRTEPKEARDLMIAAKNALICGLDNISHLPAWLSDALCRLATGGGFATRELYTNDDEMIFEAKRPVILNGIENFVTRGDLLERSILLNHPTISEEKRKPESELWAAFDLAHPKLLGALLDRIVAGLRELPNVKLDRLPRMADFAMFAVACERGTNEAPLFSAAYAANQSGACEQSLEVSPVPSALVKFMTHRERWEGTASELLDALAAHTNKPDAKDWPKAAHVLTGKLTRLAPNLRRVHGLNVEMTRTKEKRLVTITRIAENSRDGATPASLMSQQRKNQQESGDGTSATDTPQETQSVIDDASEAARVALARLKAIVERHPENADNPGVTPTLLGEDDADDASSPHASARVCDTPRKSPDGRRLPKDTPSESQADTNDDPYGTTTDFSAQAM